jgi:hypothetical protein
MMRSQNSLRRCSGLKLTALLLICSLALLTACGPEPISFGPDFDEFWFGVGVVVVFVGVIALAASDVDAAPDRSPAGGERSCRVVNEVSTTFEMVVDGRSAGLIEPGQERRLALGLGSHELRWFPMGNRAADRCISRELTISNEPGYYVLTLQLQSAT